MVCKTTGVCAEPELGDTEQLHPSIISPHGVVTSDRAACLEQLIDTASEGGAGQVVVDLSAAELLGAAALGIIVGRRHQLTLRRPTSRLARQLRLVGLDRVLQLHC